MILADKIIDLRKRNGWSQEELASKLGVSRQSVSKWESAASIPDLDKIIRLSDLFGVSTDYLLKDSMEPEAAGSEGVGDSDEEPMRTMSLEEARSYLDTVRSVSGKIALGVSLCILSPTVLIFLGALSVKEGVQVIPEAIVVGVGLPILLILIAIAVSLFVFFGRRLDPYEYMEEDLIELSYGVDGVVRKLKEQYEPAHSVKLAVGVALCIVSAVPIIVTAVLDEWGVPSGAGWGLCLILVSLGVFVLVRTCMVFGSFQHLLEEGDYSRRNKREKRRNEALATIYWCLVTTVYLAWSFLTWNWWISWIIWPCAGVLFGAVCAIASLIRRS